MKAKLFVGPLETGKQGWAHLRAKEVGFENTVVIDGRSSRFHNPFVWHRINENTKLVIINDCPIDFKYQSLFNNITPDAFTFWVERRGENPKIITVPEVIVTTELFDAEKNIGASFEHRFEVKQFSSENGIEISEHEIYLEMLGYADHLLKEASEREFDLNTGIDFLLEFCNHNIEVFEWIKEAFGNCVNEDYGNFSLTDYINDYLKEKLKDFRRWHDIVIIDDCNHSIDFEKLFNSLKEVETTVSDIQSPKE